MVQDNIEGTEEFNKRFFISDCENKVPEKLPAILESGNIDDFYVKNKNGSLNMKNKGLHSWLDECKNNPGKFPIQRSRYNEFKLSMENLFKMVVRIPHIFDGKFSYLLENEPFFQVPIFWREKGIDKKALIDITVKVNDTVIAIDIKLMADFARFYKMFNSKYQWQSVHYCRGIEQEYSSEKIFPSMLFAVGTKTSPFLARTFYGNPEELSSIDTIYDINCEACWNWVREERRPVGWKATKILSFRPKNFFD
jgi:hypothetical protein